MAAPDLLRQGRDAFEQRAWAEACALLARAEQAAPLGAEDLERLATASYLAGREPDFLAVLERAHQACQSANGSGVATPTRAASPATAGPTSATDRGDIECRSRPRATSASASSTRFSSSFTTTTSGSSATTASTSTRLVPPITGTPAKSQKRVQPTGVTPNATSVSLADGTSETTRSSVLTCARVALPSSPGTRPR